MVPRIALLALSVSALTACGGGHGARPAANVERSTQPTIQVTDDGFASAVRDLLLTQPGTGERSVRLAGVEARQMVRATARFRARETDRGLDAVAGALALLHPGELKPEVLGPEGLDALRAAAHEFAGRGDEGHARAIYEIAAKLAPDPERADLRAHIDAIESWTRDAVATGGPVQAGGALERVVVRRRLFEPSERALGESAQVVTEWIKSALEAQKRFRDRRVMPPGPIGMEMYRALRTGPAVLVSLYLRDANATGALDALDKVGLGGDRRTARREMLTPELADALEDAADGSTAESWVAVLHALRPLTGHDSRNATQEEREDDDDFADDRELFRAATFGVALEAYRLDPSVPESAAFVAKGLEELGMAEACPAVLVDAVKAHADPRTVGQALAITLHAMSNDLDGGDPDGARRAFKAAAPILALADVRAFAGRVHPSGSTVRAAMGEIELREGHLDEARALLKASAATEKSGRVLLTLARIEWRDKSAKAALDHLQDALSAPDTDHALRGEVLLTISDILREGGNVGDARTPLTEALKELVSSRGTSDPEDRARVERVLSKVLDRFGEPQRAQKALERAFVATPGDKRQTAETVEQIVARAFVRGDLTAARDGLTRAMAADLDTEDLVYFALWVRLLERQLRAPTDGAPDRVLGSVSDDGRWIGKLSAFGTGKIKAEDLVASAKTPTQKTEALFYAAMDRRAAGDAKGAEDALRQVVDGTGIQLEEVSLAREILAGPGAQVGGPLPKDVTVP